MSAPKKEEGGEAPAPSRFQKLKPVIIGAVLLAAGGGAGFGAYLFLGGGEEAAAAPTEGEHGDEGEPKAETAGHGGVKEEGGHGEKKEEGGHGAKAEGGHGEKKEEGGHGAKAADHGGPSLGVSVNRRGRAVVTLGSFTVNLRGSGGGRVLRSEVQVEVDAKDESVVVEERPALRDAVITLGSDYTYADLEGIDGKTHLRDEIQSRVGGLLEGRAEVHRIYFTEFVVQ